MTIQAFPLTAAQARARKAATGGRIVGTNGHYYVRKDSPEGNVILSGKPMQHYTKPRAPKPRVLK